MEQLPPDARVDYLQALEELSVASLGSDSDGAGRQLQEVLINIRKLPGPADFAKGVSWSDVASAVEPGSPLIYVNPTPFGTLILTVADSAGQTTSAAGVHAAPSRSRVSVDGTSATDILMSVVRPALAGIRGPVVVWCPARSRGSAGLRRGGSPPTGRIRGRCRRSR